jgi:hypothetical protein
MLMALAIQIFDPKMEGGDSGEKDRRHPNIAFGLLAAC